MNAKEKILRDNGLLPLYRLVQKGGVREEVRQVRSASHGSHGGMGPRPA